MLVILTLTLLLQHSTETLTIPQQFDTMRACEKAAVQFEVNFPGVLAECWEQT